MNLRTWLPFLDLAGYARADLAHDARAALGVALTAVPQGVAYAIIAGLPPAMGLYAAAIPCIVGSLMRSSRHVVTGPTNAVSLLVGTAVAAHAGEDPAVVAVTLASVVGLVQILAGVLRLGVLADYLSSAVVRGYITGAAILIAAGQLHHLTRSPGNGHRLYDQIGSWVAHLDAVHPGSVVLAVVTVLLIVALRSGLPDAPWALIAVVAGVAVAWALPLAAWGIRLTGDVAPIPSGLPPPSLPDPSRMESLLGIGVATAVLSMAESSSVARGLAARSGQRLRIGPELVGQGLANVAAALTSGYPVSGSLGRSALNAGAASRLSGVLAGLLVLVAAAVAGPVLDRTPVPVLAGLLLVVAVDLVDRPRIRSLLAGTLDDRLAFAGTLSATFVLRLDHAIYVGVAISLLLFLRRARLLYIQELGFSGNGRLDELVGGEARRCTALRLLQVEGTLFFGASGELTRIVSEVAVDPVEIVILRLKRTQDLDWTSASRLRRLHDRLQAAGRTLLLVGLREEPMDLLERTGIADRLDGDVYPSIERWFGAMNQALAAADEQLGPHGCGESCPLREYVASRAHDSDAVAHTDSADA